MTWHGHDFIYERKKILACFYKKLVRTNNCFWPFPKEANNCFPTRYQCGQTSNAMSESHNPLVWQILAQQFIKHLWTSNVHYQVSILLPNATLVAADPITITISIFATSICTSHSYILPVLMLSLIIIPIQFNKLGLMAIYSLVVCCPSQPGKDAAKQERIFLCLWKFSSSHNLSEGQTF